MNHLKWEDIEFDPDDISIYESLQKLEIYQLIYISKNNSTLSPYAEEILKQKRTESQNKNCIIVGLSSGMLGSVLTIISSFLIKFLQ